ncbi:MAG: hypothetical protein ACREH6_09460 [Geminicoccaceae bacterium]
MLTRADRLAKHAAVLQFIADDFHDLSRQQMAEGRQLGEFAALLNHMAASLITRRPTVAEVDLLPPPQPARSRPQLSVI